METTVDFKDRKGIIIFLGIVQILLGVISLLFFVLTLFSLFIAAGIQAEGAQQIDPYASFMGSLVYLVLAGLFVVLGIGSIQMKRWARVLSLLFSWLTLLAGVLTFLFLILFFTDIMNSAAQHELNDPRIMAIVQIIMYTIIILFLIVIPGLFVLAYSNGQVTATFEKHDSRMRWTDKCPVPVLALSFCLLYVSISPLFYVWYGWVIPFFGVFLTGVPAALLIILNSGLCVYLALQIYILNPKSWVYTVSFYSFWAVSFLLTLLTNEFIDMYRLMNFPQLQLEMLERMPFLTSDNMILFLLVLSVPLYGFFWYIRKYFDNQVPN